VSSDELFKGNTVFVQAKKIDANTIGIDCLVKND
jgi:hypothetical protein